MLRAENLSMRYFRKTGPANHFYAVKDVSLTLRPGEVALLTGRSGSGKTTLLHMLAGLLRPTGGRVLLDDTDLYALPDAELSRLRNARFGVIPQGRSAVDTLTVLENVLLPQQLRGEKGDIDEALKWLAALGIADIVGSPTSSDSDEAGVAKVTAAPALDTVAKAYANLSDEAQNPVVIMNKATYADFIAAQAAGYYNFDPFIGLPVVFNNSLPAYSTASDNAVYAIVGDLQGLQYNFPEGDGVVLKFDDISLAEKDMVKVVGREYAAHDVTAPFRFCNIAKPAAATT